MNRGQNLFCRSIPKVMPKRYVAVSMTIFELTEAKVITPQEAWCLSTILSFCISSGACYPKVDSIAKRMGVSQQHARRFLKTLKDKQLVQVVRFPKGTNAYIPNWNELSESSVSTTPLKIVRVGTAGEHPDEHPRNVRNAQASDNIDSHQQDKKECVNFPRSPVSTKEEEVLKTERYLSTKREKKEPLRTPPPGGAGRDLKKDGKPKDPSKILVDYFCQQHEAKKGQPFIVTNGAPTNVMKGLLEKLSVDDIKRRIDAYLDDDFSWYEKKHGKPYRWTPLRFNININEYPPPKAPTQPKPSQKISLWQSWEKTLCLKARSTPEREEWLRHLVSNHDRDMGSPVPTINAFFHRCIQEDRDGDE